MRLYIASVALLLSLAPIAQAIDNEDARASLKGVQGIYVVVEDLDPPEVRAGLTATDIQTDVELKLRLAGIPVLSEAQWFKTVGGPYLYVKVAVSAHGEGTWPYAITVALAQHVTLDRAPSISTWGTTWSVDGIGSVGSLNVRSIRDPLKDLVDKFINAYLAVNPKK